jgi:single-stranded-DNA-specific exonuclease
MSARSNTGLRALGDVAGIGERIDTYHAGFILGPRVNAGGRVGRSDLGARLLASDDPAEAAELARALDVHNRERREIEAGVLEEATRLAETQMAGSPGVLFLAGEGWHQGVIGIVAGRLKERYQRPVWVVALAGGIAKASGRSVAGIDLGSAIIAAREEGLVEKGGGHAMAAGFELKEPGLDRLRDFLEARAAASVAALPAVPDYTLDGALQPQAATPELLRQIQAVGPFGSGNAEPRFALPSVRVVRADPVGDGHVRCILAGSDGGRLKAIAFRALGEELGRALMARDRAGALHLAGRLKLDTWQGREEAQLQIEDAAPAGG